MGVVAVVHAATPAFLPGKGTKTGAHRMKLRSSWEWWYHEQPDKWVFYVSSDPKCESYKVYDVSMGEVKYIGKQHWQTDHEFPDTTTCVLVAPQIGGVVLDATPYPLAVPEFPYPLALLALVIAAYALARRLGF